MTLLLIDAGNTRVKWAIADDAAPVGAWLACEALFHRDLDRMAAVAARPDIRRAVVSNVAGAAMRERIAGMLAPLASRDPQAVEWFASSPARAGVVNGYRTPGQLGCDRFASAIGAHALFPGQAKVVATCGTATTVDAVTADGRFLGGMILPGLGLMATSLARNTAQLPQIGESVTVPRLFADNTDDAILSGCVSAQAGAIERAVAALSTEHGAVACLLSGGAGPMIAPHLSIPAQTVDNLVLTGLHAVACAGPQRAPT